MDTSRLARLYEAYMNNAITPAQKQELWQLFTDPAYEAEVKVLMDARFEQGLPPVVQSAASAASIFEEITGHRYATPVRRMNGRRWWMAAAAVVLLLGAGTYLLTDKTTRPVVTASNNDVAPGREGAVLTLSNGQKVVLDSLGNAQVAMQNGTAVSIQNGQLVYDDSHGEGTAYNTMTTPRGRQFRITLPDGTKAWLNAASSLRYPVNFNGSERLVEVAGEVYFEVQQDVNKPFRIKVGPDLEIQVLGTSFNINAYEDEHAIHTTVLTGSIQVSTAAAQPVVLKPGQQASLTRSTGRMVLQAADEEAAIAWKNGNFLFDKADIKTIMRQLARWYNLEVSFGEVPGKTFSGTIPRDVNVSQVFKILESTNNVHFKIEGNHVTVAQ